MRTRCVKIPYTVQVPETRHKTIMEKVPVQKCKTVCQPVTKMITKNIPVYHWRPNPNPAPCQGGDCGPAPTPLPAPVPEPSPYQPPRVELEKVKVTYEAP